MHYRTGDRNVAGNRTVDKKRHECRPAQPVARNAGAAYTLRPDDQEDKPAVQVLLTGFGDSSVNLRAAVWAADPIKSFRMKCELHKAIKERFDKEGVEIPFPYRTLVYKNKPEA